MNTIFSAGYGYSPGALRPFLESIKRHLPVVRLVLLVHAEDVAAFDAARRDYPFLELHATPRPSRSEILRCWIKENAFGGAKSILARPRDAMTEGEWRRLEVGLDACVTRFFIIDRLLAANPPSPAAKFIHCDSRDVVFQADPFERFTESLLTGAEPGTVGPRDRWIGRSYGEEGQARMHRSQVFCAGFTFGQDAPFRAYVRALCDEMWKKLHESLFHRGPDQASHIWLMNNGTLNATACHNFEGKIATVALEAKQNLAIDEERKLILVHGKVPVAVHQYDRHPAVKDFVQRLYS